MIQDNSDSVRLLVAFSRDVDLDQITNTLTENYHFVRHVARSGKSELLISFDSMTQLLEIDFVKEFGALSTKVRNSNSFCKQMSEGNHASTEDIQGSLSKYLEIKEDDSFLPKNSKNGPPRQRLTSIDDEVIEQEEAIKRLALYDQKVILIHEDKQQNKYLDDNKKKEEQNEESNLPEKECIWRPIVNGLLLTSLLVGGAKAIKFFLR